MFFLYACLVVVRHGRRLPLQVPFDEALRALWIRASGGPVPRVELLDEEAPYFTRALGIVIFEHYIGAEQPGSSFDPSAVAVLEDN